MEGNTLTYTAVDCRVQTARKRKGMPFHPCKSVGIIEYSGFAREIDDRFTCECISCYPEITTKAVAANGNSRCMKMTEKGQAFAPALFGYNYV